VSDVRLASGDARLVLARLGAEARAWRIGEVDLLWPGNSAIWREISPILFPVVGWLREGARVEGMRYGLGLHGFARRMTFAVERQMRDSIRFVARDDQTTRIVYPFVFALAVEYRLSEDTLEIALEVKNTGSKSMPYACGLHPGFNWPLGTAKREGARVRFAEAERPEVPVIAPGGLFSAEMRPIPLDGRVLPLDDALFANEALCFLNAASRSLRFEQADGSGVEMTLDGFPHIALWSRPGAPFLSLEAWTGYGDPVGFAGDLFEKPSMRVLAPGESARHAAQLRYLPAT
jgi:galactose mutarotase-like enzyme